MVAARVLAATARQRHRLRGTPWRWNCEIPTALVDRFAGLTAAGVDVWHAVVADGPLTGRGAGRVRRVARTLADLADADLVDAEHVVLAASLRQDVP